LQVLHRSHYRLGSRAGQHPGDDSVELAAPELLGRKFWPSSLARRDVEQRRKQRRGLARIELHLRERRFELGKARVRCDVAASEPQPSPFGEGMERRVLQELRQRPFDPGVRGLAEPASKLFHEPRLAQPRFADDPHELALAAPRALPAAHEQREVSLAANERSERAPPAAPTDAARPHETIERNGRGKALERARAFVLGDEEAGDLPLHGGGDKHASGLGGSLHSGGDVRRLAEHFAGRVDHHESRVEADAGCEFW
jgi:hypothetical protein